MTVRPPGCGESGPFFSRLLACDAQHGGRTAPLCVRAPTDIPAQDIASPPMTKRRSYAERTSSAAPLPASVSAASDDGVGGHDDALSRAQEAVLERLHRCIGDSQIGPALLVAGLAVADEDGDVEVDLEPLNEEQLCEVARLVVEAEVRAGQFTRSSQHSIKGGRVLSPLQRAENDVLKERKEQQKAEEALRRKAQREEDKRRAAATTALEVKKRIEEASKAAHAGNLSGAASSGMQQARAAEAGSEVAGGGPLEMVVSGAAAGAPPMADIKALDKDETRRALLQAHPDRGGNDTARFVALQEHWRELKDLDDPERALVVRVPSGAGADAMMEGEGESAAAGSPRRQREAARVTQKAAKRERFGAEAPLSNFEVTARQTYAYVVADEADFGAATFSTSVADQSTVCSAVAYLPKDGGNAIWLTQGCTVESSKGEACFVGALHGKNGLLCCLVDGTRSLQHPRLTQIKLCAVQRDWSDEVAAGVELFKEHIRKKTYVPPRRAPRTSPARPSRSRARPVKTNPPVSTKRTQRASTKRAIEVESNGEESDCDPVVLNMSSSDSSEENEEEEVYTAPPAGCGRRGAPRGGKNAAPPPPLKRKKEQAVAREAEPESLEAASPTGVMPSAMTPAHAARVGFHLGRLEAENKFLKKRLKEEKKKNKRSRTDDTYTQLFNGFN